MTKKQADKISMAFIKGWDNLDEDNAETSMLLDEALQKQTPEKPLKVEDHLFGEITCKCPKCGRETEYDNLPYDPTYCKWCGQKLDWREM